jgi:hypothetical protein
VNRTAPSPRRLLEAHTLIEKSQPGFIRLNSKLVVTVRPTSEDDKVSIPHEAGM